MNVSNIRIMLPALVFHGTPVTMLRSELRFMAFIYHSLL